MRGHLLVVDVCSGVLGILPTVGGAQGIEPMDTIDRGLLDVSRLVVHIDHVPLVVDRAGIPDGRQILLCITGGGDLPAGDRKILRGTIGNGGRRKCHRNDTENEKNSTFT